ncbi:hypothetical protein M0805_005529 [Coniferiporia weirii]|nr:hypothetical protein M0805_005529 [Coniferiporia weirii]
MIAFIFFAAGIIVGLVCFKESEAEQEQESLHFLPVPGASAGILSASLPTPIVCLASLVSTAFLVLGL